MPLPSRPLLAAVLLSFACSEKSGTKAAGMTGDGAVSPPGQEAGPTGTRGGGGPFGGGTDPDGAVASDAEETPADAPGVPADATPDLAMDRPRDTILVPVDAVTAVDSAPSSDSSDPCAVCMTYESDYAAALVRARVCNPLSKLQCEMTANTGLRCAGCKVWVTSTTELTTIRVQWTDAGCATCSKVLCPAIACRGLTMGVCHSKMLAAPDPVDPIIAPPVTKGTCIDQNDPVPF